MKLFVCSSCQQIVHFENSQCTRCGHALAYLPDHAMLTALEPVDGRAGLFDALAPSPRADAIGCAATRSTMPPATGPFRRRRPPILPRLPPQRDHPESRRSQGQGGLAQARTEQAAADLHAAGAGPAGRVARRAAARAGFRVQAGPARRGEGASSATIAASSPSTSPRPTRRFARRCASSWARPTGRCSAISATRSATTTGIGSSPTRRVLEPFRRSSATSARPTRRPSRATTGTARPRDWPTGSSAPTRRCIPGRTGPRAGRTTCTWSTRWRRRAASAWPRGPRRRRAPAAASWRSRTRRLDFDDFDDLVRAWVPLTIALNSLNRSMGLPDLYPFVLPEPAVEKIRFVHDVVEQAG